MVNEAYMKGVHIVIDSFKKNITNPEGHTITYKIDDLNHDFDHLAFMNEKHAGAKISLGKLKYFNECEYDRVIWMDADMQVIGNVDYLLSEELNSKPYWACHVHGYENYYGERMKLMNITNDEIINGGLQIINKPLLTRDFQENKLKLLLKKGDSFDGSDQGYISQLFPKIGVEIGWLDDKYNYCLQDGYRPNITDIRINHYTGKKLWQV